MRRDDLPAGYDGWQAIDSPYSGPADSVGPVPVRAVWERQTGKIWQGASQYFMSELLSEVNSVGVVSGCGHYPAPFHQIRFHRVVHTYAHMNNQACTLAQVQEARTGLLVVTPTLDGNYSNITCSYRERVVQDDPAPNTTYPYPRPSQDCRCEVSCRGQWVGSDVEVIVTISNNGPMLRTVDGRVVGMTTRYTGQVLASFLHMQMTGSIIPGQSELFRIPVPVALILNPAPLCSPSSLNLAAASVRLPVGKGQYQRHLREQNLLKFFVVAKIRETKQLFLYVCYHQLQTPSLVVRAPSLVRVGEVVRVRVLFTNPLPASLLHVVVTVQAGALGSYHEVAYRSDTHSFRVRQDSLSAINLN